MKDVSISNYRILSLFYYTEIRIHRYLINTWKHQLQFEKIDEESEIRFDELYQESERIYENILNTLKEMDESSESTELLLLGRFQEQNNLLSKVYKECTGIVESEFKKLSVDLDKLKKPE
jgi:hypothetical protein